MATCVSFHLTPTCPCKTKSDSILQSDHGNKIYTFTQLHSRIFRTTSPNIRASSTPPIRNKTRCTVRNYEESLPIPSFNKPFVLDELHRSETSIISSLQAIHNAAVIVCVRSDRPEWALNAARSALSGGISVLEITLTTPCATEVIKTLVEEFPEATIGAGTVLSKTGATEALSAGAKFLMSPATDEDLVSDFKTGPSLFIPGAMTPTEILRAAKLGARMVKIFPIGYAGGVDLIKAMRRSMPSVPLVAAHQVSLEMIGRYVAAGASAVVVSDAIFHPESMTGQDLEKIKSQARKASELGRLARAQTALT